MRATIGVEAVGLDPGREHQYRRLGIDREMWRRTRPWLAEVTVDAGGRLRRRFLRAKVDYRRADRQGRRGVWYWWVIDEGRVYQLQHWPHGTEAAPVRRWVRAVAGEVVDIPAEEVWSWLAACSASTS